MLTLMVDNNKLAHDTISEVWLCKKTSMELNNGICCTSSRHTKKVK